jgi:hypothetical protein
MNIKIYDKNVLGNRLLGTSEYSLSSLLENFQQQQLSSSSPFTSSLELTVSSVSSSDNSSVSSTPCIIYRKTSERVIPLNEGTTADNVSIGTLSLHYTLTSSSSSLQ